MDKDIRFVPSEVEGSLNLIFGSLFEDWPIRIGRRRWPVEVNERENKMLRMRLLSEP
jgi:hypothetical protein